MRFKLQSALIAIAMGSGGDSHSGTTPIAAPSPQTAETVAYQMISTALLVRRRRLAARGASPALHRGQRCARLARRDE